MLLMIDNYDSFTYNLVQYFGELGEDVRTYRNDEITLDEIAKLNPERICLSPGPSNPQHAGITLDVLRATFPAGTLSGAPKVRAMELIDELEPVKRGLYGGAVGYLSFTGEMDLAITIRTGVIHNGNLYVQAAAGIVADSVPESEWQETENKARAVLRAAEQVQDGLDSDV